MMRYLLTVLSIVAMMTVGACILLNVASEDDECESDRPTPVFIGSYKDGDLYRLDVQPRPIYYYEKEDGTIKIVSFVTTTGSINVAV